MPKYKVCCNSNENAECMPWICEIEAVNPRQAVIMAAYWYEEEYESYEPTDMITFNGEGKDFCVIVTKQHHHFAVWLYKEEAIESIEVSEVMAEKAKKCENYSMMYKDFREIEEE
ncbi:MAG: hypothetical protein K6F27_09620 [Ruminococcus sp.]|nr:hypothetical protein [Ruminococcus sp.]